MEPRTSSSKKEGERHTSGNNPDLFLKVPSIIARHGYICETHSIISEGYVLNVFRIPISKNGGKVSSKTVLLQHGFLVCSFDWILNGPEKALAYVLADNGYDVWMTNIRGCIYSKEHLSLKEGSKQYWDFTWHEVAVYDIPAIINYIKSVKEASEISYIGFSMGTTTLFSLLSMKPEYNKILKSAIALAPVVFMKNAKSPYRKIFRHASCMSKFFSWFGYYSCPSKNSLFGKIFFNCSTSSGLKYKTSKACLSYLVGLTEDQVLNENVPLFIQHSLPGNSFKTVVHFSQIMYPGDEFRQFDYGEEENIKRYGSKSPPEYDLSNVTLPLVVFWSKNDKLSDEEDVKLLKEKMHTSNVEYCEIEGIAHFDYNWARDARSLLIDKVLNKLENIHK